MKSRMFRSALLLLVLQLPVRIVGAADAVKADAIKADATKGDATKGDATKGDAAKADAAKADTTKADTTKADATKADATKPDALPKPFTFARYQGMTDHSPFAVATKVEAPVEAPNFAKDLYVANAARSKEGDMVTVASATDKNFKKYLISGQPSDGYTIANIEWSDKVGATKVTISKDGQSATLGFNEALMRQPGSAPPPGANPAAGAPPQPVFQPPMSAAEKEKMAAAGAPPSNMAVPAAAPNQPKAMPVPMVPTPPPRVRGVIPRNPNGS